MIKLPIDARCKDNFLNLNTMTVYSLYIKYKFYKTIFHAKKIKTFYQDSVIGMHMTLDEENC